MFKYVLEKPCRPQRAGKIELLFLEIRLNLCKLWAGRLLSHNMCDVTANKPAPQHAKVEEEKIHISPSGAKINIPWKTSFSSAELLSHFFGRVAKSSFFFVHKAFTPPDRFFCRCVRACLGACFHFVTP